MGPVGSGKTTLLKVIAGLYAPTKGRVLVDGFDRAQLSPADWRSHVAWVGQDAGLFRGTLRDNLLMGAVNVTDERFLHVIQLCGLDGLIKSSPQGLDIPIGEAGQALSGGQKQMVSLARALMSEKSILLLDEPTNSLDLTMEKFFLTHLRQELVGKWVVVATHRPAPVEIAQRLLILDQGKIIADGAKDTVLSDIQQGKVFKASASHHIHAEAVT
jgi:ATP-binding cassette subfamily C protein LapB